jgi:hypothetical protein
MLTLLCSVWVAGCETTIAFENQLSGVVIDEITFAGGGEEVGYYGSLVPGETSETISVQGEDAGLPGRVKFILNVEGRTILLEAEDLFDPEDFGHRVFVLTADTPVRSPLHVDEAEE